MTASMPKASGDDEVDTGNLGANGDDDDDDLLAALRDDESDGDDDAEDEDDVSDEESEDQDAGSDDSDDDEDDDDDSDIDGFPGFDDEISDTELDMGEQEETSATQDVLLGTKRKGKGKDEAATSSSKRKKSEKMPLFGSFDDYAHLIDNDEGLE